MKTLKLADLGWASVTYRIFGRNASRIVTATGRVDFCDLFTSQRVAILNTQYQLRANDTTRVPQ